MSDLEAQFETVPAEPPMPTSERPTVVELNAKSSMPTPVPILLTVPKITIPANILAAGKGDEYAELMRHLGTLDQV